MDRFVMLALKQPLKLLNMGSIPIRSSNMPY